MDVSGFSITSSPHLLHHVITSPSLVFDKELT